MLGFGGIWRLKSVEWIYDININVNVLRINVSVYRFLSFYIRPRGWTVRECFPLTFEDVFMFSSASCIVIDHQGLLFSSDRVTQARI